jgi:two-component sensor histidine kinase
MRNQFSGNKSTRKKHVYLSDPLMNLLLRFLRQGTSEKMDPFDARRILLLNLFYGVATLALIAAVTQSLISGEPVIMTAVLLIALLLLVPVPFIARKAPDAAAVYITFITNGIVFFFGNCQGLGAGTFVYYFPLFLANGWLMDFRKPINSGVLLGITMLSVMSLILIPDSLFGLTISKEIQRESFVFNITTAAIAMSINTLVIVWMNYRRQQELEIRIEEREKATSQLSIALKQKEILLAEIHHRVKNNLAIVRGLLNMQMNTTTNEVAKDTLRESVNRVSTMALIHQKLYTRENPDQIDFGKYVLELVREISSSYNPQFTKLLEVNTDVKDITLNLNRAVPCGLILNEFLSNAFKHAFKQGQRGIIDIMISHDPEKRGYVNMIVTDNGNGIPEGFNPETSSTLGISIVQSLSEQLDGHFTFGSSHNGTQMKVNFPL